MSFLQLPRSLQVLNVDVTVVKLAYLAFLCQQHLQTSSSQAIYRLRFAYSVIQGLV